MQLKTGPIFVKLGNFFSYLKIAAAAASHSLAICCKKATRAVTTLCGGSSGSQVLAGGVSERQPPPAIHPPPFGKQGNSRSLQMREELGGGARAPDEGIQKPPIGGSPRARTCGP